MRNEWIRFGALILGLAMALVQVASADDSAAKANHPCRKIEAACIGGGYSKGGHKIGKGLWKDCVQPILAGKTVDGVTVSGDDVSACKAKREGKKDH
ncbi:MAG: hypothetical protein ACXWP5_09925 [Bdellovibrionota bacterium]